MLSLYYTDKILSFAKITYPRCEFEPCLLEFGWSINASWFWAVQLKAFEMNFKNHPRTVLTLWDDAAARRRKRHRRPRMRRSFWKACHRRVLPPAGSSATWGSLSRALPRSAKLLVMTRYVSSLQYSHVARGLHSTEVGFALLTQWPRVRIPALLRYFCLHSLWKVEKLNPSSAYVWDFANAISGKGLS